MPLQLPSDDDLIFSLRLSNAYLLKHNERLKLERVFEHRAYNKLTGLFYNDLAIIELGKSANGYF